MATTRMPSVFVSVASRATSYQPFSSCDRVCAAFFCAQAPPFLASLMSGCVIVGAVSGVTPSVASTNGPILTSIAVLCFSQVAILDPPQTVLVQRPSRFAAAWETGSLEPPVLPDRLVGRVCVAIDDRLAGQVDAEPREIGRPGGAELRSLLRHLLALRHH